MAQKPRSNWNLALEHALNTTQDKNLTASAWKLYVTLLRLTLGWNRTRHELGVKLILDTSGLHTRSFERARAELVERGLVAAETHRGRGARTLYVIFLESPTSATDLYENEHTKSPTAMSRKSDTPDQKVPHQRGDELLQCKETKKRAAAVPHTNGTPPPNNTGIEDYCLGPCNQKLHTSQLTNGFCLTCAAANTQQPRNTPTSMRDLLHAVDQ